MATMPTASEVRIPAGDLLGEVRPLARRLGVDGEECCLLAMSAGSGAAVADAR